MDPIADMLTTIRNGLQNRVPRVVVPFAKVKLAIAKKLVSEGFIKDVKEIAEPQHALELTLRYAEDNQPMIQSLKRISKPGRRVYTAYADLRPVRRGLGVQIISTSSGVLTDKEAKEKKQGGEVLCEIY
jgi:small subunit ribosomal protein S8